MASHSARRAFNCGARRRRAIVVGLHAVAVVMGLVVCTPAPAQTNEHLSITALDEQIDVVRRVVRHGIEQQDAMALLVAASLLRASGIVPSPARQLKGAVAPADEPMPSVRGVLARAQAMAQAAGRNDWLALIQDAQAAQPRGVPSGHARIDSAVEARDEAQWSLPFQVGARAQLVLDSADLSALTLEVWDGAQIVCPPAQSQTPRACEWKHASPEGAKVVVRNAADKPVKFKFAHN